MKIHFIAIGGSVMHSLAIALKTAGHTVSGSDDAIYEPSHSRLAAHGLLPSSLGWDAARISADLDAVILGMHAFTDNPELARAKELNLPIYSYPEFILHQSRNKQRVVVAGSFGKTTTTAMLMHILRKAGKEFDYMVGGQVPGFDNAVKLTETAPLIILEGDEYPASKLDMRPKFAVYEPHMVLLTGISWDHANVFPTEDAYVQVFESLVQQLPKAAMLVYNAEDPEVNRIAKKLSNDSHYLFSYKTPSYKVEKEGFVLKMGKSQPVKVIGRHNMSNIAAAIEAAKLLGLEEEECVNYIADFEGVGLRMQLIHDANTITVIRDFAHAPAKVAATISAAKERYKRRNLIAVVELHTFSSLSKNFLPTYKSTIEDADHKIVCVDAHALAAKRMEPISREEIVSAFGEKRVVYVTSADELRQAVAAARNHRDDVLLLMSSGNFMGVTPESLWA